MAPKTSWMLRKPNSPVSSSGKQRFILPSCDIYVEHVQAFIHVIYIYLKCIYILYWYAGEFLHSIGKSKYIPESRASDFEGTDLILPDRGMEYWFKWILSQRRFFKFLCSKFVSIKMHEYAWVLPNGVNPNDLMCIRYQMNSQLLDQKTAWFWLTSTICYIHVHNHIINHIINHKTHVITITPLGAFFAISPAPKIDGPCLGTVAGHVQRHRDVHQPRWRRCHAGGNLKNPWRILTVPHGSHQYTTINMLAYIP